MGSGVVAGDIFSAIKTRCFSLVVASLCFPGEVSGPSGNSRMKDPHSLVSDLSTAIDLIQLEETFFGKKKSFLLGTLLRS